MITPHTARRLAVGVSFPRSRETNSKKRILIFDVQFYLQRIIFQIKTWFTQIFKTHKMYKVTW